MALSIGNVITAMFMMVIVVWVLVSPFLQYSDPTTANLINQTALNGTVQIQSSFFNPLNATAKSGFGVNLAGSSGLSGYAFIFPATLSLFKLVTYMPSLFLYFTNIMLTYSGIPLPVNFADIAIALLVSFMGTFVIIQFISAWMKFQFW